MISKKEKRTRRHTRIRAKVKGTAAVPRLSVFRSNKHLYAQLIDDEKGITLVSSSDMSMKGTKQKPKDRAKQIGGEIAKKAKAKKIERAVFDRGGFAYTGNIEALAMAAREGGLTF